VKDAPTVFATKYFAVIQQEQTIIKDNMTLANLSEDFVKLTYIVEFRSQSFSSM